MNTHFTRMLVTRFKLLLQHPLVIGCLVVALVASLLAAVNAQAASAYPAYPIAVVNEDGDALSLALVDLMDDDAHFYVIPMDRSTALRKVATGQVDGVFIIRDIFSENVQAGDFHDTIEFYTPLYATSAWPISELISEHVVSLWLDVVIEQTLAGAYDALGDGAELSPEEAIVQARELASTDDIIDIVRVDVDAPADPANGSSAEPESDEGRSPFVIATGLYAVFSFFAIMLSAEWAFGMKTRAMQERLTSANIPFSGMCLASQAATALFCVACYGVLLVALHFTLPAVTTSLVVRALLSMALYTVGSCAIAVIVALLVQELSQLLISGTFIAIIHLALSGLTMPLPAWSVTARGLGKLLPGTHLLAGLAGWQALIAALLVNAAWLGLSLVGSVVYHRVSMRRRA